MNEKEQKIWESGYSAGFQAGLKNKVLGNLVVRDCDQSNNSPSVKTDFQNFPQVINGRYYETKDKYERDMDNFYGSV